MVFIKELFILEILIHQFLINLNTLISFYFLAIFCREFSVSKSVYNGKGFYRYIK